MDSIFTWSTWLDRISTVTDNFDKALHFWVHAHLINVLLILLVTWVIRRFGSKLAMQAVIHTVRADLYPSQVDRKKRIRTLQGLIEGIFQVGTWTIAFLLIVSELRPNYTAALFTSAGVLGLALGFGAQSLIKDFVSGIFIILENQYRVGDTVTLNQITGKVEGITVRTTVIRDLNGYVHHVPNGIITVTTNQTLDYGRINEDVAVKTDTDIAKLEKAINEAGDKVVAMEGFAEKVQDAPHFDSILTLDADKLTVKVVGKVSLSIKDKLRNELLIQLKKSFEKNNIKLG